MASIYQQTIPPFIRGLKQFSVLLTKAAEFAKEKGLKPEDVIAYRLVPDQQGLAYQVRSCTDTPKFLIKRLGNIEVPVWEDEETTFEELQARVAKGIAFLEGVDPSCLDGAEKREALLEAKSVGTLVFENGQKYVSGFAVPNFHFHMTTGYCLIRAQGVPLGALDYMGPVFKKKDGSAPRTDEH